LATFLELTLSIYIVRLTDANKQIRTIANTIDLCILRLVNWLNWDRKFIDICCSCIIRPVAQLEVWARGNFSWKGPLWGGQLANTQKKTWEIMVNTDVDGYIKTVNHRTILRKTQKNNNLLKTKKILQPK